MVKYNTKSQITGVLCVLMMILSAYGIAWSYMTIMGNEQQFNNIIAEAIGTNDTDEFNEYVFELIERASDTVESKLWFMRENMKKGVYNLTEAKIELTHISARYDDECTPQGWYCLLFFVAIISTVVFLFASIEKLLD